ncbi:MAG: class I SAM-dependent methyltransferase, partial [Prevotella sp.]|nr:class I SAM-dependent methyltransferase [Prevotella sp.]
EYLNKLAQYLTSGKAYGFDRAYRNNDNILSENVTFINDYYSDKYGYLKPNVIICRHVLGYIQDTIKFLKQFIEIIQEDGILFLEVPDVDWALRNNAIFDFYYEYLFYYTHSSLKKILELAGYEVVVSENQFNGQYLCVVAKILKDKNLNEIKEKCSKFAKNRDILIKRINHRLSSLAENGAVFLWGAGGKGVAFVNMFDPDKRLIQYLVDINSVKKNTFVAKTGHEIISPEEFKMKIKEEGTIIVLNDNYIEEIKLMLIQLGIKNISIISYTDIIGGI